MKKYKFRKMFFVCEDKKIIPPNVHMTQAYQFKATADTVAAERIARTTPKEWEDKTKPVPVASVEGFYLVPEQLYDLVIKPHVS